ncbi:uncharacterized protein METZ01_LOCUS124503 [marine metagenome]|uniref:Uncharacterized protein n=1 Tax=marine metagenome TaxID=408172 RepID=A0A381Y3J4_9ZZZZ
MSSETTNGSLLIKKLGFNILDHQ